MGGPGGKGLGFVGSTGGYNRVSGNYRRIIQPNPKP